MEESPIKTLITGASGLLGSHLLLECCSRGIAVQALARNAEKAKALFIELADYYGFDISAFKVMPEFIEGDILDIPRMESIMQGVTRVIHTAAIISVHESDRWNMQKVNVEGTANLVNIALDLNVTWFCYVSSVATLGPNPEGLVDEDYFWKPGKHHSAYAVSKYMAEQEVWRGQEEGLPICVVNPSVILGPSPNNRGSSSLFYRLKKGLPAFINGASGYVDVRDVSAALCLLMQKQETGKRIILSAENLETRDFLGQLANALKVRMPHREAGKIRIVLARLGSKLLALITGKKADITADVIRMAASRNRYDSGRSIALGITYRDIRRSLQDFASYYQSHSPQ